VKVRKGFVSNSSSSSFIVKKKGLTKNQENDILNFLLRREGWGETELIGIDNNYIWGWLEAHNPASTKNWDLDEVKKLTKDKQLRDSEAAAIIFEDMMIKNGLEKNLLIQYEDYVTPLDFVDDMDAAKKWQELYGKYFSGNLSDNSENYEYPIGV